MRKGTPKLAASTTRRGSVISMVLLGRAARSAAGALAPARRGRTFGSSSAAAAVGSLPLAALLRVRPRERRRGDRELLAIALDAQTISRSQLAAEESLDDEARVPDDVEPER